MRNYREINQDFASVYLEDSFVMGIMEDDNYLEIIVDFVLKNNNPYFNTHDTNWRQYKIGKIMFSDCSKISWTEKFLIPIPSNIDKPEDFGNIDIFTFRDNIYYVSGEWGKVQIQTFIPPCIHFLQKS